MAAEILKPLYKSMVEVPNPGGKQLRKPKMIRSREELLMPMAEMIRKIRSLNNSNNSSNSRSNRRMPSLQTRLRRKKTRI